VRWSVFILCLLIAGPSWAGIGTVTENKGTVCNIERGKAKMSGLKGTGVESNDIYATGACVSDITFNDNTKVKVNENSRLLIDDFVYDPKASDAGKLAIKVGMGTVRYASGQIAKNNPQHVDIKTPTASIAVRGTDFTMSVDETGESLIVLLPSCKDPSEVKTYELEENRCKVGVIEVRTVGGVVVLDKAFEATFVISANASPTSPRIINTVESKINNNIMLSKPPEITKAINTATGKSKKEEQDAELEAEAARRLAMMVKEAQSEIDHVRFLLDSVPGGPNKCDPAKSVCVAWENPGASSMSTRGKAIAFRSTQGEHFAEVKTIGWNSNTFVSITHDDNYASTVIGDPSSITNVVNIKQNVGVVKIK
jgi:hypothetical protein